MKCMNKLWTLSAALCLACNVSAASIVNFAFKGEAGKYPVGFKVIEQYDHARVYRTRTNLVTGEPYPGERSRPVQTLVWYPAATRAKPMLYRDYFSTLAAEDNFTLSSSEKARRTQLQIDDAVRGLRADIAVQEMARPMSAARDVAAHQARFPVIIYAPSFGSAAMENADLCEYLASHGYLVIASAPVGARSRAMTMDLDGLEAQAGDIAFLIAYARSLGQADTGQIGVIGFSWGGLANVLAAAKDDRIGAVVSLDGSLRAHTSYVDGGPKAARYVTPARLAAPLLYVAARPHSVEVLSKMGFHSGFSLMNQMKHADTFIMTMHPMSHSDFDAYQLRFLPDTRYAAYSRQEAANAYGWTARYVHRFLDAYLKGDAPAKAFLHNAPAANGVPAHVMSTDIRLAASAPPTVESLVAELGKGGFVHAIAAYERIKAREPGFGVSAAAVTEWGSSLRELGRHQDAAQIFKLGAHLYPDKSSSFLKLAEAPATK